LAAFVSPFSDVEDFEIFILTDLGPDLSGKIVTPIPLSAAIDLSAHYDGAGLVTYTLTRNISPPVTDNSSIPLDQLIHRSTAENSATSAARIGPVDIRLLFYPRKSETSTLAKLSLGALRDFLDDYAGVRIYRDSIRVKPYGDATEHGGDWLLLGDRKAREPAGAARPTFRVAPNQLVGAVFLTRDGNPQIVDSTAREGLIHSPAFESLRALTLACVSILEGAYHEAYTERSVDDQQAQIRASIADLTGRLTALADNLTKAQTQLPARATGVAKRSVAEISDTLQILRSANRSIEQLASQATVYRGLATTGIAATVFGHETQSALAQVEGSVSAALLLLSPPDRDLKGAREELEKARTYASRVASWGSFALVRVQRDKRRRKNVDLRALVEKLADEIRPVFEAADIELRLTLGNASGRTFGMDVESVLINLLTNAYMACQQVSRRRVVAVEVVDETRSDRHGVTITVADSGPGVAKEFVERVWEPLFSTRVGPDGRQVGTGLGLAIVSSIVDDLGGQRSLSRDPKLKGARFEVWIPLD
jgi:signal transduction histidine kinase